MHRRCGHAPGTAGRDESDEELAEEDDLASSDLLAVDRQDWPRLVAQLEAPYRVGELHGLDAAKVWLTELGITWRELAETPKRPRGRLRSVRRAPRVSRPLGQAPSKTGGRDG